MHKEKSTKHEEIGRKGGKATAKKHGKDYMREISLRGVAVRLANLKKKKQAYGANRKSNNAPVPDRRRA